MINNPRHTRYKKPYGLAACRQSVYVAHIQAVTKLLYLLKPELIIDRIDFNAAQYRYSLAESKNLYARFVVDLFINYQILTVSTFLSTEVVYTARCETCEFTRQFLYVENALDSCRHMRFYTSCDQ